MAVQQPVYTPSMQANADRLVSIAHTWTRGYRKADRVNFAIFPSSKPGRAYYANETGCTCPSWLHRGACSHVLAYHTEAENAREAACQPKRKGYAELFPANEDAL